MTKKSVYMLVMFMFSPFFNALISCNVPSKPKDKTVQPPHKLIKHAMAKIHSAPVDTSDYIIKAERYRDSVDKNLAIFKVKKKDIFSSAEGGEIDIYTDKPDTLKIRAIYYGETGKNEYYLYLRNEALIFFKEKSSYYKSPIGKSRVKIDSIILKTFVLKDGVILIGKKGKETITADSYQQKSNAIKDIYKEIFLQLKE